MNEFQSTTKLTRSRKQRARIDDLEEILEFAELGKAEGKLTQNQAINKIHKQLSYSFDQFKNLPRLNESLTHWKTNGNFGDFYLFIKEEINSRKINRYTIENWFNEFKTQSEPDSDISILRCACVFAVLAQSAFNNGEIDKAWVLLTEATYMNGFVESVISNELIWQADTKYLENRRKGGINRADKYKSAKYEVIRLLKSPPQGGWEDSLFARKYIKPLLEQFIEKEFEERKLSDPTSTAKLTKTNLDNLLRDWFIDEGEIRTAFYENSLDALLSAS